MKKLHEQGRTQIKKVNEQYKSKSSNNHTHLEFKLEDLCMATFRERKVPFKEKEQARARADGPHKVMRLERMAIK